MFDPVESAKEAGLKYVSDDAPGIRRKRRGKGFSYHDDTHGVVSCEKILGRIKGLVIPPAWENVWICRWENGHLQVTGRDARNRKQYRYHEKWTVQRNTTKFHRLQVLSAKLPVLRRKIEADLKLAGLPREKVLAAVVKLMLLTQSRVGNSEYAEENETYGLTTILNEHAEVHGKKIELHFRGKSGVDHDIELADATLAKIIKRCQELPGEELFAYKTGDTVVDINSQHVNDYLRESTGEDFTAKDLRTWGGTCQAIKLLTNECLKEKLSATALKKRHVTVIKATAQHLRNTVAVCRKYYIHPAVFAADEKLLLEKILKGCRGSRTVLREEKVLQKLLRLKI